MIMLTVLVCTRLQPTRNRFHQLAKPSVLLPLLPLQDARFSMAYTTTTTTTTTATTTKGPSEVPRGASGTNDATATAATAVSGDYTSACTTTACDRDSIKVPSSSWTAALEAAALALGALGQHGMAALHMQKVCTVGCGN